MTEVAVAQTTASQGSAAGTALSEQIMAQIGTAPDAVILFASPQYDFAALLDALEQHCRPKTLVGCSSAGEFSSGARAEGSACAVALRAPEMAFRASVGRGLRDNREAAARELVAGFEGLDRHEYVYRSALVLTDALAGYADDLVEQLSALTAGCYQFFGGGAGDDARFQQTHVFYGREVVSDAAVALEILSNKPLGIGVHHGWQPATAPMRVTAANGSVLVSLDNISAADVFEEQAESRQRTFDRGDPLPYFLHNVVGLDARSAGGEYRLRVPLGVNEDGSVACAADVPVGSIARLMESTEQDAARAAKSATEDALQQLDGHEPAVALFFDCVATRLRLGNAFEAELEAVQQSLGTAKYAGFNTYGQIARADGQFSGFHNCTAVVCVFPK